MKNKKEKIILLSDIEKVGKKKEIKEVSMGFAHNFLIPNKKALLFNKVNQVWLEKEIEKELKKADLRGKKELEIFEKINNLQFTYFLKKEKGRFFGSINTTDIIKDLKKEGIESIKKSDFIKFIPINKDGNYLIELKTSKNLISKLKIKVKSE